MAQPTETVAPYVDVALWSGYFVVVSAVLVLIAGVVAGIMLMDVRRTFRTIRAFRFELTWRLLSRSWPHPGLSSAERMTALDTLMKSDDQQHRILAEYIERSWSATLQSVVSLCIIGLIAVLMLLQIVRSDAGLPIIAAVAGAAVSRALQAPAPAAPPVPPGPTAAPTAEGPASRPG
jgi:hypothetical protein